MVGLQKEKDIEQNIVKVYMHLKIESILNGIEKHLESISNELVCDLVKVIDGEIVNLRCGETYLGVETIFFEYDYDSLNIYFWQEDAYENMMSDNVIQLPLEKKDDLFPKALQDLAYALEDDLLDEGIDEEELYDDILMKYDNQRCDILEKWFVSCWNVARSKTSFSKRGYFSVHDTHFKTKLE